jgi:hypothetical protein
MYEDILSGQIHLLLINERERERERERETDRQTDRQTDREERYRRINKKKHLQKV